MSNASYVLIIAEKPKAASKIAQALGISSRKVLGRVPIWEGFFKGRKAIVAPAAGHLFSLATNEKGYPVFNYFWVPRWEVDKNSKHTREYFNVLRSLAKNADEFINACDYDIEGSVIGYLIIKHFGDVRKSKRVKFSSLTKEELIKAFDKLQPLDLDLVEAGLCRHELDWVWGINVSRALMDYYKTVFNESFVLSAGRVQSPTLIEVLKRHVEIETFVPEVSFNVAVYVTLNGRKVKLENEFEPPLTKSRAENILRELRKVGFLEVVNVVKESRRLNPPPPFNLSDLQYEAYRLFKMSPSETLRVAESLYLDQLISYPRTNSQKLPKDLNHLSIIKSLRNIKDYREYIDEVLMKKRVLEPVEGVKEDSAHPAIYPTGYLPRRKLTDKESLIYDLIVRRYLASLSDPAVINVVKISFKASLYNFSYTTQEVLKEGWMGLYPNQLKNYVGLGDLNVRVGSKVKVERAILTKTFSRPPPRYNKSTLLKWMESENIGTEATRAEIIETLFKRGYLKQVRNGLDITDLGIKIANVLMNLFAELSSVQLTREFEDKLNKIISNQIKRGEVIEDAIKLLKPRLLSVKNLLEDKDLSKLLELSGEGVGKRRCVLCSRSVKYVINGNNLCEFHGIAYQNVIRKFNVWKERAGLDFKSYVEELSKTSLCGTYVKEVLTLFK